MQKPARLIKIEETIAKAAGITVEQLNSTCRERTMADARAAVWYIAKDFLRYTYTHLGDLYGRDHSTIMSGVNRIRKLKSAERIIKGIRSVCPEVFDGLSEAGTPRKIEDWSYKK